VEYAITRADRAPLPASWSSEPRYLGYREVDRAKPYARFFRPDTLAVQPRVVEALVEGMSPAELGYGLAAVADRLPRPGYEPIETGWTRLDDGVLAVSVLTRMPRVTAAMWDWWFGWHSRESARYKLWHPCAHQFAALGADRGADRSLTDRQRYVENVSYVDEYIGGRMEHLAIRFIDPDRMGFADRPGHTFVCARVSLAERPIAIGWLVHQVRPTEDGCEMRSRFFLNDAAVLPLPTRSLPAGLPSRVLTTDFGRGLARGVVPRLVARMVSSTLGTDMIHHCAAEMNHLASFLPELFEEFRDLP